MNGGPGIQNYQPIREDPPEAETEVPIATVLSDVEEPMDTSTQSITSRITLEKYNTDADTDEDDNAGEEGGEGDNGEEDENGENLEENESEENKDEAADEDEGESGKRWEDDGEDEEEKEMIEKEKS